VSQDIVTIVVIVAILIAFSIVVRFVPIGLYITAQAAGVPGIDIATLIGMRLRKTPHERIILPLIAANKAGVDVTVNQLETHYMAKGNVDRIVNALISAKRAGIPLTFAQAAAIDLAGRNVLEAVQMSVHPKVVELPPLKVVTKDGVETETYVKVTVRSRIDRFVNSDEAALITAVSRELSIAIATADSYKAFADDPQTITQLVIDKEVDREMAYEIVAIDINGVMPFHAAVTVPLSE
jgi:uncharacterized protein YqfA (UPF0365 family)